MSHIVTKRGSQDNISTYEHMCDTVADMNAIEKEYKTFGSVCVVLSGESGGVEAYICNSAGEWCAMS